LSAAMVASPSLPSAPAPADVAVLAQVVNPGRAPAVKAESAAGFVNAAEAAAAEGAAA